MRVTTDGSWPYSRSPMRASPEIFRRTRRYLRSAGMGVRCQVPAGRAGPARTIIHKATAPVLRRPSSRALVGTSLGLLDALADLEARIARKPDRGASLLGRGLDHLGDAALAVDHIELLQEHALLVELAQLPLDDLVDDRV